jgi:hypothetical protein
VRQSEPVHQPQTDLSRRTVPLDAGDQKEVALGVECPMIADSADTPLDTPRDDWVRDDP